MRLVTGWFDGPAEEVCDCLRSSGASGCTPVMHAFEDTDRNGWPTTLTHRHWVQIFGPADVRTQRWWEEGVPSKAPWWLRRSSMNVAPEPHSRELWWQPHSAEDREMCESVR